ncbi:hypothetical protein E2562_036115, partial [Oryza meyeriana var. granulata]
MGLACPMNRAPQVVVSLPVGLAATSPRVVGATALALTTCRRLACVDGVDFASTLSCLVLL